MNRTSRRKLVQDKVSKGNREETMKAVNIALARQKAYYEEELRVAKMQYFEILMTMTAYTLNGRLGLGKTRLPKIMDAIVDNIDSFRTGQLEPQDYDTIKGMVAKLDVRF